MITVDKRDRLIGGPWSITHQFYKNVSIYRVRMEDGPCNFVGVAAAKPLTDVVRECAKAMLERCYDPNKT